MLPPESTTLCHASAPAIPIATSTRSPSTLMSGQKKCQIPCTASCPISGRPILVSPLSSGRRLTGSGDKQRFELAALARDVLADLPDRRQRRSGGRRLVQEIADLARQIGLGQNPPHAHAGRPAERDARNVEAPLAHADLMLRKKFLQRRGSHDAGGLEDRVHHVPQPRIDDAEGVGLLAVDRHLEQADASARSRRRARP